MSDMIKKFPAYLHQPFQILVFEMDEFGMFLITLIFALVWGGIFYLFIVVVPYGYSKTKKKYPRGFIRHLSYFAGLSKMDGYPTYFEKEFKE